MKKLLVLILIIACLGQVGFADTMYPENQELGNNQEIFYQMTVEESMRIKKIDSMAFYPAEEAVYLLKIANRLRNNELFAVTQEGIIDSDESLFYRDGFVLDFEVEGDQGYVLGVAQGQPYLMNTYGEGILIDENAPNRWEFEVCDNQYARIGLPIGFTPFMRETYQIATLPVAFVEPILRFDRELEIGAVFPEVFDFSADGEKIIAFGYDQLQEGPIRIEPQPLQNPQNELQEREELLYIEILTIPTEPNLLLEPLQGDPISELDEQTPVQEWPKFEVKVAGYGDFAQRLEVRDIYTTEDHIIVLFHELNQSRAFIQRYSYDGELVDQLETNFRTRRITAGPEASTLYLQKWFLEEDERQMSGYREGDWRLEIIRVNWGKKEKAAVSNGRMKPVIAERTVGGKTIARFNDQGFGLIKELEKETGIMDYRAPLKSASNDVRLQIPYCDLLAKAGAARDLLVHYQGQEIRISMDTFAGDLMTDMPCDTEATVEIHLTMDESGNLSYTIEFFVVEQVDAVTRVVHRKPMQEIKN